jgi:nicotinate dehydrogenase subunit B
VNLEHARTEVARDGAAPPSADLLATPVLSRWLRVRREGTVEVRVGKVELGQGVLTALAQLVADELGVDLDRVVMLPASTALGPDQGLTAGSTSVSDAGPPLRVVAAAVRGRFVAEAARRWRCDPDQVDVSGGALIGPGGERESYAGLAALVDLDVEVDPGTPPPPDRPARWTGASAPRLDLPDKVAGRPRFVHDVRLPGQLFGRVLRPPSPGARLAELDDVAVTDRIRGPHGVQVVRDGSFLAVLGPDEGSVGRAAEALRPLARWHEQDLLPDEDDLDAFLRNGPHEDVPVVEDEPSGRPDAGPGSQVVRARYTRPFLAHASMAPSCAVARWDEDGRVTVWSHSQGIHPLRDAIAAALDLEPSKVDVEHVEGAGCYGHNGADDAAFDAVLLARQVPGRPVQVLWSRQDELTWSPFGSAMSVDVEAVVDGTGRITAWSFDVWSQGHSSRPGYRGVPGLLAATTLADPAGYPSPTDPPLQRGAGMTRNAVPGYDVGHRRVVGHRRLGSPIRTSALRALGAHLNVLAIESAMDEVALATGQDPLQIRLAHLTDERTRRVLQVAAERAGWGRTLPEGTGLGLGVARYKSRGAYCAVVAEVDAGADLRLRRLVVAVDVGRVVNPDGVRNQIEGGATQSASWTLRERVRFDRRRITSDTWESYPILRFSEAPDVVVELVEHPGDPSVGAGEAAQGPTAAAIANAVAAAVGVRVRDLPITTEAVVAAIEAG